jgi:hypothetical protein
MPQDSYTDFEEKLARAQRERDEALEQQTVSGPRGALQPVKSRVKIPHCGAPLT